MAGNLRQWIARHEALQCPAGASQRSYFHGLVVVFRRRHQQLADGRSLGAFNPIDGGVPVPNATGQVLFAITDGELSVQQPLTSSGGWRVNSDGTILVAG